MSKVVIKDGLVFKTVSRKSKLTFFECTIGIIAALALAASYGSSALSSAKDIAEHMGTTDAEVESVASGTDEASLSKPIEEEFDYQSAYLVVLIGSIFSIALIGLSIYFFRVGTSVRSILVPGTLEDAEHALEEVREHLLRAATEEDSKLQ